MIFNNHTRNAFAAAVLIAAGLPITATAAEKETRCDPLYRTASGRLADASYSATRYSEEHVGAVGVSIFPGLDIADANPHAFGLKLVQILNQYDVEAACFVNHSPIRSATSISYNIDGLAWREGSSNLDLSEAQNEETIRAVIMEANTIGKLLGKKQP